MWTITRDGVRVRKGGGQIRVGSPRNLIALHGELEFQAWVRRTFVFSREKHARPGG